MREGVRLGEIITDMSVVVMIIEIVLYIAKSIKVEKLAEGSGVENAWYSWIPILDLCIIIRLIFELNLFGYRTEEKIQTEGVGLKND